MKGKNEDMPLAKVPSPVPDKSPKRMDTTDTKVSDKKEEVTSKKKRPLCPYGTGCYRSVNARV